MSAPSLQMQAKEPRLRPDVSTGHSLAVIAIFHGLTPEALAQIGRRCRWRRYEAGQSIVQYQDESRDVFFVVNGRACAIYHAASGREVRFADIVAGDMFGEFAAIDGEPRTADVVAITETLVASITAEAFWEMLRQHETVGAAVLRHLTRIARSKLRRLVEFSTLPVRSRLHAELLRLANADAAARGTAVISPAPTHAEIASRISTHREAVTRELSELARTGLIEKRDNDIVIRDTAALAHLVQDVLEEPAGDDEGAHSRDCARGKHRR